jgi:hypothetical protein
MWVRQGRTDAWIAHKLDVSIDELSRFKREHQLVEGETFRPRPADPLSVPAPEPAAEALESEELAEDVEPPVSEEAPPVGEEEPEPARRPGRRAAQPVPDTEEEREADSRPRRRRGRRGGRRHRGRRNAFEATFDHGEEGYGLWLDPAVVDNEVYSEHWAGHRAVTVTLEPDAITIRRAGSDRGSEPDGSEPSEA